MIFFTNQMDDGGNVMGGGGGGGIGFWNCTNYSKRTKHPPSPQGGFDKWKLTSGNIVNYWLYINIAKSKGHIKFKSAREMRGKLKGVWRLHGYRTLLIRVYPAGVWVMKSMYNMTGTSDPINFCHG